MGFFLWEMQKVCQGGEQVHKKEKPLPPPIRCRSFGFFIPNATGPLPMFKRYAITIVLTLFLAMPSTAGDTPDFDATKKLAEQGYILAQFSLGLMYANGEGVPQNDKEAVKWFTKAAEQGEATAQFNLGLMYAKGQGVPQNDKEAVKWYTKAAEQGDATAQSNLGFMYTKGRGVPQNDKEAVKWFTKAAEQGDAMAQYNLGLAYAKGQGVPQNYEQAYIWLSLSAAQSPASEDAAKFRDMMAKTLSPERLNTAQQRAAEVQRIVKKLSQP